MTFLLWCLLAESRRLYEKSQTKNKQWTHICVAVSNLRLSSTESAWCKQQAHRPCCTRHRRSLSLARHRLIHDHSPISSSCTRAGWRGLSSGMSPLYPGKGSKKQRLSGYYRQSPLNQRKRYQKQTISISFIQQITVDRYPKPLVAKS